MTNMKTLPVDLVKRLKPAVERLNAQGINGFLYKYAKNECTCCYGPDWKGKGFTIQQNTAQNQGGPSAGRITFTDDPVTALTIAQMIAEALDGSAYRLDWEFNVDRCMFIVAK